MRTRALRLLAKREFGSAELRARLLQGHSSSSEVDALLEELRERNWLDDTRAARVRALYWHRRGFGRHRAELDLRQRGFAEPIVARAVAEVFVDDAGRAKHLLETRFPDVSTDPRARARAARFLLRRGYGAELVMALVGEGC